MYIPFSQDWTIFELYISSTGKKQQSYFAKKVMPSYKGDFCTIIVKKG